ncbi:condensation domain-containing protein, partial [Bacillus atrophaeus]
MENKEYRNHWIKKLSDRKLSLPIDFERNGVFKRNEVIFYINDNMLDSLKKITNNLPFLNYVTVLTAIKICFHHYSECKFITVGTPLRRKETEKSNGSQIIVLGTELSDSLTSKELMIDIRQNLLNAYDGHEAQLDQFIKVLDLYNQNEFKELFDVLVSYKTIHYSIASTNIDLNIIFEDEINCLKGTIYYNSKLYKEETITNFKNDVLYILNEMVTNLDLPLMKLQIKRETNKNHFPEEFIRQDNKNGKVNLSEISSAKTEYIEPRNKLEESIAKIWREILGVEKVGVFDNFFEYGGDSILSIKFFYRMKQQRLNISPKDLIAYPTISELAKIVDSNIKRKVNQNITKGKFSLTASQLSFFCKKLKNINYYNNSWIFEVKADLKIKLIKETLSILANHHDAIRLRFKKEKNEWMQYFEEENNYIPIDYHDLSNQDEDNRQKEIEKISSEYQGKLNIEDGPLIRTVFFDCGKAYPARLLVISHRLLTDTLTMEIIWEDFQNIYQQLIRGENPLLAEKTTSFQYWAKKINEFAQAKEVEQEMNHWGSDIFYKEYSNLPVDFDNGSNTEEFTELYYESLTKNETTNLLRHAINHYKCSINDILYTALSYSIKEWTGDYSLLIETGSHGREIFSNEIDLSRTVGWFTTTYPVSLQLSKSNNVNLQIGSIKQIIDAIPSNGFGFGLLRYLNQNSQIQSRLQSIPKAKIAFEYQGQLD